MKSPPGLEQHEVEAFHGIFRNVEAGSLELFARLRPPARAYFLGLAEPILLKRGDDASVDALYSVDYIRRPVDPLTFLDHTDYMGHVGCDVWPAWRPHFERVCRQNSGIHEVILTGAMGIGKAQPLTAKVLTPSGWKLMRDVRVGDVLVDPTGGTTRVVGVYPQGEKTVHEVVFSDESRAECCAEHLWEVNTPSRRHRGSPGRVLPLEEILRTGLHDGAGNRKHFIPMIDSSGLGSGEELPLDPYVLGVLLGDGGFTTGTPRLSSADEELVEEVQCLLPDGVMVWKVPGENCDYSITSGRNSKPNPVTDALRAMELYGLGSEDKFIPGIYTRASFTSRVSLLQGLLDTDGSRVGTSCVEFSSVSKCLADGVVDLIRSLGGVASINSRATFYTYGGGRREGKPSWRVIGTMPETVAPFRLSRKAGGYAPGAKYGPSRSIERVTVKGLAECQCIQVDNPRGLYVTDDYVVTHNTMIAMFILAYKIYRVSLLRDPAAFFGLQARSKIVFGLYALTKDQIEDVGFYVLRDMLIDQSPYFAELFPRSPYGKETISWPQRQVHVITGSGTLHAIGRNLFALAADELNYFARGEKTANRARDLVAEVSRRLESRFVGYGGDIPGVSIFISQTRTARDFLEQRIRDSKGKEGVYVLRGARWKFNPKGYDPHDPTRGHQHGDPTFRVFVGDEVRDACILDEVVKRPDGTVVVRPVDPDAPEPGGRVLDVPVLHYKAHLDDLHGALRAIDDVPTASFTPFFPRREVLDRAFDDDLGFPFPAQTFRCHEKSALRLQDLFDYAAMTTIYMGRRRPIRHPDAPRYLHLDLSQTGDRTGVALVHASEFRLDEIGVEEALDPAGVGEGEVVKRVEVDFYVALEAGEFREPIDYGKIRVFVEWLRRCGFWIRRITADRHQSFDMLQRFREMGFEADFVSVDRSSDPYKTLRQACNEGRMALPFPTVLNPVKGTHPIRVEDMVGDASDPDAVARWAAKERERRLAKVILFQELTGLEHDVERNKVDHRAINPDGTPGSKDIADAVCGAVYTCLMDKVSPGDVGGHGPHHRGKVARSLNRYLQCVRGLLKQEEVVGGR